MPWPLEPDGHRSTFADGLDEVVVIEEKRPMIEEQLARLLVNRGPSAALVGKIDERGAPLVPNRGELMPDAVAKVIAARLCRW